MVVIDPLPDGLQVLSILFWNTRRGAVGSLVQQICALRDVDVVILAEETRLASDIFPVNLPQPDFEFSEYAPVPSKMRFFLRKGRGALHLISDNGPRESLRELFHNSGKSIIIAGVHLPSRLYADDADRYYSARLLRQNIEVAEERIGHSHTVVIGDMNMSPYEPGMCAADGLHGVMDKALVQKDDRVVRGKRHSYFYNPMWSRLGDESAGPSGTYYYGAGGIHSTFWHTFDQALIRPALIPAYQGGSLEVLTEVGGMSLLTSNRVSPSDHLPILLRLSI